MAMKSVKSVFFRSTQFLTGVMVMALILTVALAAADNSGFQEMENSEIEDQQSSIDFQNRRKLNGHTFMPNRWVAQPFINGWLRMTTGIAFAQDLKVPLVNLNGEQLGVDEGEITALLVDAEFQHRLGKRLAVRIGGTGSAHLGTNQVSVISQGIKAVYGFNLGATFKILQSRKAALSATGDIRFNRVLAFNLIRFTRSVVEYGLTEDNSLLDKGMSNIYVAGLNFAYSPSKWFGFTALGEGGYGTPFLEGQDNSGVMAFAVGAEFDLGVGTKVPLGLMTFLKWNNYNDLYPEFSDSIWNTGLTIGYTGVKNFFTGLEISYSRIQARSDALAVAAKTALNTVSLGLVIRHYF